MSLILGILDSGGAAASTSSYESIATYTGSASTTTFSSIASTYSHLQLRINWMDTSSGSNCLQIRFNGDTANNYYSHQLIGNGSAATAAATTGNGIFINDFSIESSSDTYPNVFVVDIIDYASATKNKTIRSFFGNDQNRATPTKGTVGLISGAWFNTNAVTSLTVRSSNAVAWTSGTSIALYGIKG